MDTPNYRTEQWLDSNLMTRHCLGIAATGGGKSNFLNLILKQQMMRGGGCLHIDGKNSKEAIAEFLNLARIHDRWQDVRIINIGDAAMSNTYNPLLRGDADELTSRIMMLIEVGKEGFFRSQAETGLRSMVGLLREMDMPICFQDLLVLMRNEQAMRWLLHNSPKDSREYVGFKMFYEGLLEVDRRTGATIVNERKLQHTYGDLIGRLDNYTKGQAGLVLNTYNPEVDLYQAIQENALIYVALPMLSKTEAATNFAKFMISDLRTAIGKIQNDPIKPAPTFLALMDEFSSYAIPSLAAVFEQARSANICLFPFIQTISSLKDKERGLSEDFCYKVLGNTWSKISFVLKDPESAEMMSKIAGEHKTQQIVESEGEKIAFGSDVSDNSPILGASSRGRDYSRTVSYDYEPIARPETFQNLQMGEGIFIGPSEVLKVRIPHVQIPKQKFESEAEELDFPRFDMPLVPGLNMLEKYLQPEEKASKVD